MGPPVNVKTYHNLLESWAVEIIDLINEELSQKILKPSLTTDDAGEANSDNSYESTRMMRQIFTLGELSQLLPHKINKKLFLLMQSIVFEKVNSTYSSVQQR